MSVMRVVEALGRADASTGWTVLIGAGTWLDLAGLPRATFDEVFPPGPGRHRRRRVRPQRIGRAGRGRLPRQRALVVRERLPARRLALRQLHRHVRRGAGAAHRALRAGPGRHRGHLDGVGAVRHGQPPLHASATRSSRPSGRYNVFAEEHSRRRAAAAHPDPRGARPRHRRRRRSASRKARSTTCSHSRPTRCRCCRRARLAANPLFQYQVADADVRLRAARSLLYAETDAAWAAATAGDELHARSCGRGSAPRPCSRRPRRPPWSDCAYTAGGGSSLYATSPLQRRLRDVHAMTQHFLVKLDTLTTCGAVLAGADADLTIF